MTETQNLKTKTKELEKVLTAAENQGKQLQ